MIRRSGFGSTTRSKTKEREDLKRSKLKLRKDLRLRLPQFFPNNFHHLPYHLVDWHACRVNESSISRHGERRRLAGPVEMNRVPPGH